MFYAVMTTAVSFGGVGLAGSSSFVRSPLSISLSAPHYHLRSAFSGYPCCQQALPPIHICQGVPFSLKCPSIAVHVPTRSVPEPRRASAALKSAVSPTRHVETLQSAAIYSTVAGPRRVHGADGKEHLDSWVCSVKLKRSITVPFARFRLAVFGEQFRLLQTIGCRRQILKA
ncbi:hypothetical protein P154DRAFT_324522 [Amniculicola lignicola CBS 123094]|uniref:Uncharacterized protein n=1 Tax=Amniculicola lignicola CBS 123094 TaxID=1392246 RepID=A0A6A5W2S7_9PLEO|nr:hypothetical protein P154DRAFT_324522 [Amniculicola lignicola CBS 123094]